MELKAALDGLKWKIWDGTAKGLEDRRIEIMQSKQEKEKKDWKNE